MFNCRHQTLFNGFFYRIFKKIYRHLNPKSSNWIHLCKECSSTSLTFSLITVSYAPKRVKFFSRSLTVKVLISNTDILFKFWIDKTHFFHCASSIWHSSKYGYFFNLTARFILYLNPCNVLSTQHLEISAFSSFFKIKKIYIQLNND